MTIRDDVMADEPDERAYNPSLRYSYNANAMARAQKATAEANADMARVAAIDGVPWQAKIQYIYGKYGESTASNFVRNGGMAPAKDFVGADVTNEFSNWLAGLQSQNAHANDSAFDKFGSTLSGLAHDPAVQFAAITGGFGGMTGAQAATGGDIGAGLKTDLSVLGAAAAGAGAAGALGAEGGAGALSAEEGAGWLGGATTATGEVVGPTGAAVAGEVGATGSIADAASNVSNFVNTGSFDAGMADFMGMGDPQSIAAVEQSLGTAAPAATAAPGTIAQTTTGVSSNPANMLMADAGTTTTDVTAGMGNAGGSPSTPGVGDAGAFDQFCARSFPDNGTSATIFDGGASAANGGGIINGALDFAKANPLVTLAGAQLGAGIIGGIGNYVTQNELMDKKVQADKELLAQKTAEEEKLAEWRRRFIQGGSYFDAKMPFKPSGGGGARPGLRRPDGTPVYSGGIINIAQRGG